MGLYAISNALAALADEGIDPANLLPTVDLLRATSRKVSGLKIDSDPSEIRSAIQLVEQLEAKLLALAAESRVVSEISTQASA